MKKLIANLIGIILFASLAAQPYENAAGIKAGYSTGIVFKHFANRDFALEAQALYNTHGFQITALYEYQFTPHPKERLQYFVGAGALGGNWDDEFSAGVAAILGTEFIFRKAPLILGLEWKPMLSIYKPLDIAIPDIGLTAKVILN